jgi:hypothetical protein
VVDSGLSLLVSWKSFVYFFGRGIGAENRRVACECIFPIIKNTCD